MTNSRLQLKPMSCAPKPNGKEYFQLLVLDEWMEMGKPSRGWTFVHWQNEFNGQAAGWYGDDSSDLRNPQGWILSTTELPTEPPLGF